MINNIRNNKPLPVYGKGENVRDWLWVEDHASAIDTVFHNGVNGETYNIGGHNEWKNIDLVHLLCRIMDQKLGRAEGESAKLITYVTDRAGHDLRYAIDAGKIERELGWKPSITFEVGLGAYGGLVPRQHRMAGARDQRRLPAATTSSNTQR